MIDHKIQEVLGSGNQSGLFTATDLVGMGLSFRQVGQLVDRSELIKIDRGLYATSDTVADDRFITSVRIPKGVFCLFSACFIHELTDFVPSEQHLAIPKKARFVLPAYPPIKLYYWEKESYQTGVMEYALTDHQKVRVYDPEKTICDLLRMRNSMGDITKEAVKTWIARPDRDIAKAYAYAALLRVSKPLDNYLNILL
jgi:predicted transcriptional regulator of viral defense system